MRLFIACLLSLMLVACDRQKQAAPQPPAADAPMGVLDITHHGGEAPATPFLGPDDGPATLGSFRGKPVLVNLWATWCAPCKAEMPTLDGLAAREAGRLQVVAVSQDMEGRRAVTPYFAEQKFAALKPYLDKQNVLMLALKTDTLPITILYDAKGKELWRVTGSMDWTGDKAKKLIDGALGGSN